MSIKKLPQYLINQLKAWEIIERPASIVKELIENSLDAWATSIQIELAQWWKERIIVRDNWVGVSQEELPKMIERYATSKIHEADDLYSLSSYGFRGEALSAIAEVSSFSVHSKVTSSDLWYEIKKIWSDYTVSPVAFSWNQGTHVIVDQLFADIPVREKYLKSQATEWKYIRQLIVAYTLIHYDKEWVVVHNGKRVFALNPCKGLAKRASELFQSARENKMYPFEYKDQQLHCWWLRGDASLHFPSNQYIYCVVNGRAVTDKLLRKAILKAYSRQIVPWTYPFVVLFVEVDPTLVDVNVHPRKMEVTFLDPWSIFNLVKHTIQNSLGDQKISYSAFTKSPIYSAPTNNRWVSKWSSEKIIHWIKQFGEVRSRSRSVQTSLIAQELSGEDSQLSELKIWEYMVQIIGQYKDMYIIAQSNEWMILIDQHALAERVTFEKMRNFVKETWFTSEILLTPLTLEWSLDVAREGILTRIWFDISKLSDHRAVVYAVPEIFQRYSMDLWLILQCVEWLDTNQNTDPYEVFSLILDEILGMKACKASIKAWQRLNILEMEQLIRDATGIIEGLFVCQHGRPSAVLIPNSDIDTLFDRH